MKIPIICTDCRTVAKVASVTSYPRCIKCGSDNLDLVMEASDEGRTCMYCDEPAEPGKTIPVCTSHRNTYSDERLIQDYEKKQADEYEWQPKPRSRRRGSRTAAGEKQVEIWLKNPTLSTDDLNRILMDDTKSDPRYDQAALEHRRMFREYEPIDRPMMSHAITYTTFGTDMEICDQAFQAFNVGGVPGLEAAVTEYRSKGGRSLSVGDVVVVNGTAYGCSSFGWDRVQFTAARRRVAEQVGQCGTCGHASHGNDVCGTEMVPGLVCPCTGRKERRWEPKQSRRRVAAEQTVESAIEEILRDHLPIMKGVVAEPYWNGFNVLRLDSGRIAIYDDRPQSPGGFMPPADPPSGEILAHVDADGTITRFARRRMASGMPKCKFHPDRDAAIKATRKSFSGETLDTHYRCSDCAMSLGYPQDGYYETEKATATEATRRMAGGAFPGAGAQVYYNEEGEPLGWDYPSESDPYDLYEDDAALDFRDFLDDEDEDEEKEGNYQGPASGQPYNREFGAQSSRRHARAGSGPGYYVLMRGVPSDGPFATPSQALASISQNPAGDSVQFLANGDMSDIKGQGDKKIFPSPSGYDIPQASNGFPGDGGTQVRYDMGLWAKRHAKIAQIRRGVLATNPRIPVEEAQRIAVATVRRFPDVVKVD